jgi:hypothetical protein
MRRARCDSGVLSAMPEFKIWNGRWMENCPSVAPSAALR